MNLSGNQNDLVVSMQGIVKKFPGVLANDHVDFYLKPGSIHALLGENGAGKSTLMNILAGLYTPDSGTIKINGKQMIFSSPRQAINAGIGMIHQHFMLVPSQTVTENVLLGLNEPRFRMNLKSYDQKIADLSKQFGLLVDPQAKVWQLSVGEQQRVEILKMLYRGAAVLIMDEPTAVLAPKEIDQLCETLQKMVEIGKSIIFISHKLNEVMNISDEISVLRKGKITAEGIQTKQTNKEELARLMVGREVLFNIEKKATTPGEIVLSVNDLYAENDKSLPALRGVSLNIRAGEIVGLAGVAGNGQSELAEVLTGLRHSTKGSIVINDIEIANHNAKYCINHGVSHVPEDRTHVGSAPNLSITDNLIMKKYNKSPISHSGMMNMKVAETYSSDLKISYDIMAPSTHTPVRLLSGGNLQRVILAREISSKPALLVAMQPTRGLDVGAIEGVQRLLLAQREAGASILLISEELEELFSLSDRIYVIYEGQIMGEVVDNDIEKIGLMMTGTSMAQIEKEGEISRA
jgi:ABC-type uncharacterized transport system ATPase subunit